MSHRQKFYVYIAVILPEKGLKVFNLHKINTGCAVHKKESINNERKNEK